MKKISKVLMIYCKVQLKANTEPAAIICIVLYLRAGHLANTFYNNWIVISHQGSPPPPPGNIQPPLGRVEAKPGLSVASFLQLAIQFTLSFPSRPLGEQNGNSSPAMRSLSNAASNASSLSSGSNGLLRQNSNSPIGKPGALPNNLDDMKVTKHL